MDTDKEPIYTEEGQLFCKRYRKDNGEIELEGAKGAIIKWSRLQELVFDPSLGQKKRRKRA